MAYLGLLLCAYGNPKQVGPELIPLFAHTSVGVGHHHQLSALLVMMQHPHNLAAAKLQMYSCPKIDSIYSWPKKRALSYSVLANQTSNYQSASVFISGSY
jgi:hypothetical protein